MKKSYFVIIILLAAVISLSVAKAALQNALSTSGVIVSRVEKEISFYKTQNAILSEEFLKASSLTNISKNAQDSGFTNENNLMVLKTSRPLAVRR